MFNPNISGSLDGGNNSGYQFLGDLVVSSGAFSTYGDKSKMGISGDSSVIWGHKGLDFYASSSNALYGKTSNIVQPMSIRHMCLIRT